MTRFLQLAVAALLLNCLAAPLLRAQRPLSWSPEETLATAAQSAFVIDSGDLDGDGHTDIVFVYTNNLGTSSVTYLLSDGEGGFVAQTVGNGVLAGRSVLVEDIDGDGAMDVVAGFQTELRVQFGAGDGTVDQFVSAANQPDARYTAIEALDADGDGDLDLIAYGAYLGTVVYVENLGGRTFATLTVLHSLPFATGGAVFGGLDLIDLGGPLPALAFACPTNGTFGILGLENLPGGLAVTSVQILESAAGADTIRAADVDGDGDLDLVGGSGSAAVALRWFENQGGLPGALTTATHAIATSGGVAYLDVADLDGDGAPEIVTNGSNTVRMLRNLGGGSFAASEALPITVSNSRGVHVVDADGDGIRDVLATGFNSNHLQLLRNRGILPGSGEDFVLEVSSTQEPDVADRVKEVAPGELVTLGLRSPLGTFDGISAPLVAAQFFTAPAAPASPVGFPQIYVNPGVSPAPFLLIGDQAGPLGPTLLAPGGIDVSFIIPPTVAGLSLVVQALAPTSTAQNEIFAISNAYELHFDN